MVFFNDDSIGSAMADASDQSGSASKLPETALIRLRDGRTSRCEAIRQACVWEVTAAKPGNVHPGAAFADCSYDDFCRGAEAIAPILGRPGRPFVPGWLGTRVSAAVSATRRVTAANVNLGIILLLAPLAAADDADDVAAVLASLTPEDGRQVFQAIRRARPGGLGAAPPGQADAGSPVTGPLDLVAAMGAVRMRDRIARQYADNFTDFFVNVVPVVARQLERAGEIAPAIVRAQLQLLAAEPDSLIARKCTPEVARQASRRAAACLAAIDAASGDARRQAVALAELDRWFRQDGHRRNPGTTADLIAAALYWLIIHG